MSGWREPGPKDIIFTKSRWYGRPEKKTYVSIFQETLVVEVAASHCGIAGAGLVSGSGDSEAQPGDISVSAGRFPISLRLCGLADRGNRLTGCFPQGKTLL